VPEPASDQEYPGPPHRLADLTVGQIAAHLDYWQQAKREVDRG